MTPFAYYSENDPFAAAWLNELIKAGHVMDGYVDTRSIADVAKGDLEGFTQCHFFAGIGGWSYALKQAGWPDDRQVWTGSCPCQPFSSAGKQQGLTDDRHLWPVWFRLIEQSTPPVIFGEQVASALAWLDVVYDDLENAGYAFAPFDFSAAGAGAPHIRQRIYFVADADRSRCGTRRASETCDGRDQTWVKLAGFCDAGELGNSNSLRINPPIRRMDPRGAACHQPEIDRPSPLNGFWESADWLPCADDKLRPVEPGTFPLAHGVSNRVGRLRGYGNAICAPLATTFIEAYLSL